MIAPGSTIAHAVGVRLAGCCQRPQENSPPFRHLHCPDPSAADSAVYLHCQGGLFAYYYAAGVNSFILKACRFLT